MECSSVINKKTTNTHKSVDESHAYHSQWKRAAQKATDSKTPLLWYALKSETTGREVSGCQRLYMRAAHAKSLQPCPTLCDLMDCSLLGSSVHGFSRQEYWSGLPCPRDRLKIQHLKQSCKPIYSRSSLGPSFKAALGFDFILSRIQTVFQWLYNFCMWLSKSQSADIVPVLNYYLI